MCAAMTVNKAANQASTFMLLDLNGFIIEDSIDGVINNFNAMALSTFCGVLFCAAGDGDRVEAGLSVGNKMAVAHNKPTADATDAPVFSLWERGVDIEIHEEAFSPAPVVASMEGSQNSVFASKSFPPISLIALSGSFSSGS